MRIVGVFLISLTLFLSACSRDVVKRAPASGALTADQGGATGYQHGIDRSKFVVGTSRREANEFGFVKVVGSEGTFAVDVNNGLALGIPNANSARTRVARWYTHEPAQHNQLVMDYFVNGGIRRDQVGGVHATTSLSAAANGEQSSVPNQEVGGYQSVLERKAGEIPVVDSIAWARMNDSGEVLTEWVYWPAIAGGVIADAKRMQAMLLNESEKAAFLARLPPNLPPGNVVIRHSSPTATDAFEAFASYDVFERKTSPDSSANQAPSGAGRAISMVRHFDVEGRERRLPQERARLASDYPTAKRPAPSVPSTR